jgi:hypothetical protein
MLAIKKISNRVNYFYDENLNKNYEDNKNNEYIPLPNLPVPRYKLNIEKWYKIYFKDIHYIIDYYLHLFYDFVENNPEYNCIIDENKFKINMIKLLYSTSYNTDKNFVR